MAADCSSCWRSVSWMRWARGGSDALIDPECLAQVVQALAGVALLEVAAADSLEGACFLGCRADDAGDAQRPGVPVMGLAGGRRAERELSEPVQRLSLAEQVAEGF